MDGILANAETGPPKGGGGGIQPPCGVRLCDPMDCSMLGLPVPSCGVSGFTRKSWQGAGWALREDGSLVRITLSLAGSSATLECWCFSICSFTTTCHQGGWRKSLGRGVCVGWGWGGIPTVSLIQKRGLEGKERNRRCRSRCRGRWAVLISVTCAIIFWMWRKLHSWVGGLREVKTIWTGSGRNAEWQMGDK